MRNLERHLWIPIFFHVWDILGLQLSQGLQPRCLVNWVIAIRRLPRSCCYDFVFPSWYSGWIHFYRLLSLHNNRVIFKIWSLIPEFEPSRVGRYKSTIMVSICNIFKQKRILLLSHKYRFMAIQDGPIVYPSFSYN